MDTIFKCYMLHYRQKMSFLGHLRTTVTPSSSTYSTSLYMLYCVASLYNTVISYLHSLKISPSVGRAIHIYTTHMFMIINITSIML